MNEDILGWLLALIILTIAVCGGLHQSEKITDLEEQYKQLEKINKQMESVINNYEWQIKQVPYVIESWCKGE